MIAPMVRLVERQAREKRQLRRLVASLTKTNERLTAVNAVLLKRLVQARRDAELLALMSHDREAALSFIRTAHSIEALEDL